MSDSTPNPKLHPAAVFTSAIAGGAALAGFPWCRSPSRRSACAGNRPGWPRTSSTNTPRDFAKKVNDMSGGRLKIEVLPAGAVVKAFELLDAVSKGTLDGGHGVVAYWYGKNSAVALWGPARLTAWTPTWCWPGTTTAAARNSSTRSTRASISTSSPFYGPMPTQPFGWFKNR